MPKLTLPQSPSLVCSLDVAYFIVKYELFIGSCYTFTVINSPDSPSHCCFSGIRALAFKVLTSAFVLCSFALFAERSNCNLQLHIGLIWDSCSVEKSIILWNIRWHFHILSSHLHCSHLMLITFRRRRQGARSILMAHVEPWAPTDLWNNFPKTCSYQVTCHKMHECMHVSLCFISIFDCQWI